MNGKEEKRQRNRLEARRRMMRRLDDLCGLHTVSEVGGLLQTPEAVVNAMIASGEIIAFRGEENEWQVPGFQFHRGKKLPCLDEIKERLGNVSNEAICTFFFNPIRLANGQELLPWKALASEEPDAHASAIKNEAARFMRHIAR